MPALFRRQKCTLVGLRGTESHKLERDIDYIYIDQCIYGTVNSP